MTFCFHCAETKSHGGWFPRTGALRAQYLWDRLTVLFSVSTKYRTIKALQCAQLCINFYLVPHLSYCGITLENYQQLYKDLVSRLKLWDSLCYSLQGKMIPPETQWFHDACLYCEPILHCPRPPLSLSQCFGIYQYNIVLNSLLSFWYGPFLLFSVCLCIITPPIYEVVSSQTLRGLQVAHQTISEYIREIPYVLISHLWCNIL